MSDDALRPAVPEPAPAPATTAPAPPPQPETETGGQSSLLKRNVAELARRESARELGSSLILQVYRVIKTAQIHALENTAVVQQIEQTAEAIRLFASRTDAPLTLLFAQTTAFVSGQLLKGSRSVYQAALELGQMLSKLGLTQVTFTAGCETADVKAFVGAFIHALKDPSTRDELLAASPHVRLRNVSTDVLTEDEASLPADEIVVRTYASAVVVLRRLFEDVESGHYQLPHQAKRIAQKLVMLSEGDTPAFLGVTAMRNANHDAAGRAVNTSILAVAMARQITSDLGQLARIAMSAILHDVGRPIVVAPPMLGATLGSRFLAPLGRDDETHLPAATALVMTAMGKLYEPSMVRSVITYESTWQRHRARLGALYGGAKGPTVASRIVATAHRFNELLTPDPGAERFATPDEAILTMNREAENDVELAAVSLLVGAIGIFPTGTAVELTSGERGVVVATSSHPALYASPSVLLVYDARGRVIDPPIDVDLSADRSRSVKASLRVDDARLREASRAAIAAVRALEVKPPSADDVDTDAPPRHRAAPHDVTTVDVKAGSLPAVERRTGAAAAPAAALALPKVPPAPRLPAGMPTPEPVEEEPPRTFADSALASTDHPPFARGELAKTPFVNLLVYVLERALTGTLILHARGTQHAGEHAVYFEAGVPAKAWSTARTAPLAGVIASLGLVDVSTLPAAMLGDDAALERHLFASSTLGRGVLRDALRQQLYLRLGAMYSLPATTTFAFYLDVNLLSLRAGAENVAIQPKTAILAAVRAWPDRSRVAALVERLANLPLDVAQDADLETLGLTRDERRVTDLLGAHTLSLPVLLASEVAPREVVENVLAGMLLTHALRLGEPPRPTLSPPPRSFTPLSMRAVASPSSHPGRLATPPSGQPAVAPQAVSRPPPAPATDPPSVRPAPPSGLVALSTAPADGAISLPDLPPLRSATTPLELPAPHDVLAELADVDTPRKR